MGAEVNWGVRFRNFQHVSCLMHYKGSMVVCSLSFLLFDIINQLLQIQHFLLDLCKEVSLRLQGCGVQGRTFTLKVLSSFIFVCIRYHFT